MIHLKLYENFKEVSKDKKAAAEVLEIDFSKLKYTGYHFNYGYEFNFLYKNRVIGGCSIYYNNCLNYEDTLFELGLNRKDYKKDYHYLHDIGLKKKYKGFGIGIYLLNKIMTDYNIKGGLFIWNKGSSTLE